MGMGVSDTQSAVRVRQMAQTRAEEEKKTCFRFQPYEKLYENLAPVRKFCTCPCPKINTRHSSHNLTTAKFSKQKRRNNCESRRSFISILSFYLSLPIKKEKSENKRWEKDVWEKVFFPADHLVSACSEF
jgi:hypothetical protein